MPTLRRAHRPGALISGFLLAGAMTGWSVGHADHESVERHVDAGHGAHGDEIATLREARPANGDAIALLGAITDFSIGPVPIGLIKEDFAPRAPVRTRAPPHTRPRAPPLV